MRKTTISTALTFYFKYIATILWLLMLAFLFFSFGSVFLFALILPLLLLSYALRLFPKIKRVQIDSDNLYISNYLNEAVIPFHHVDTIEQIYLSSGLRPLGSKRKYNSPDFIRIRFVQPTAFGNFIIFMPQISLRDFLLEEGSPVSTTARLQALANRVLP